MLTDLGTSATPEWAKLLADTYIRKREIDLESTREDRNLPDRVDLAAGVNTANKPQVAAPMPLWAKAVLGVGGFLAVAAVLRALR